MNAPTRHQLRRPPPRRGVTLIEVLATIVLMGIVLPVAMHAISLCLAATSASRHRSEATSLAESKLASLVATGDWQYGNTSGDFGADWPEYEWQAEIVQWDPNATTVSQLTVRVKWVVRGENHFVDLSTLIVEPQTTTGTTAS